MTWNLLIVGLGGGLGSIMRYGCSRVFLASVHPAFPWATFAVNFTGSLAIGLIWGMSLRNNIPESTKLFLMAGLCGGFTTFSAFSLESIKLIQENRVPLFFLYAAGSVALCLVATYTGIKISGS